MANFKNCTFKGTTEILDANEYIGCTFFQCRIIVTRGNFTLKDSSFDTCKFEFGGEAANIKNLVMLLIQDNQSVMPKKGKSTEMKNND